MASYSIIIRDGAVFDGRGNHPVVTDIGIEKDSIRDIGDLSQAKAEIEIDAAGKYVSPGFIDLTTHSDTHWTLFLYPMQESMMRQGITTILGGNCGFSVAPLINWESVEEIGRWVDMSHINVNWQTVSELLEELGKHRFGVNFGTLVGLNTLRKDIGDDYKDEEEETKAIGYLLRNALSDGAFGLSTNFGLYKMESWNDNSVVALAKILAKEGGLIKHHLEDEGRDILPSLSRVVNIARRSGARTDISHFRALGKTAWPMFPNALNMFNRARGEGIPVTCDFSPYMSTDSELLFLLPSWARKMPRGSLYMEIQNQESEIRKNIIKHLADLTLHYDGIIISAAPKQLAIVGKSIRSISSNLGLSEEETILRLLSAANMNISIFNEAIQRENIQALAKENFSIIASDGVGYDSGNYPVVSDKSDTPYPGSFGAFPRALELLAKELGVVEWSELIHKMTGLPAEVLGLGDRGVIAKKNKADIVVFDPASISAEPDYEKPFQFPLGIIHVIINGRIAVLNGETKNVYAGKILKKK